MNIFFFGGTSFAAQNLLKELKLKNKIFSFSRRKNNKNFLYFDLDKRNKRLFKNLKIKKIDYLFYFSSFVPFDEKNSEWEKCKNINIFGLINLLNDIKIPIKKIILASSCSIYGSEDKKIFYESSYLSPENFYSMSKFMQEKLLQVYCDTNEIDFLCYRIGYVFGSNMNKKRLVKKILLNHKERKKIKIYNKKMNLNLIHTKDISYLIHKTYRKAKGIFNLTNSKQVSLGAYYKFLTKKESITKNKMNNFSPKKIFKKFKNLKEINLEKRIIDFANEN
tara:strand:- start:231 stop:1064 length:834 start_codon:yes stop_codon:yes gene_type:complete